MVEDKPTAAFALSLVGGIFVLLNGVMWAIAGGSGSLWGLGFFDFSGILLLCGAIGIIFGFLIILGGIMMYVNPNQHVMWGVIVLILSILSLGIGGGFFIGFILGLIGGILALVWKPTPQMVMPMYVQPYPQPFMQPPPGYPPQQPQPAPQAAGRFCPKCGASVAPGAPFCQACGTKL